MFAAFGIQLVEQVSISRSEERAAAKCQQGPDCESGTVLDNGVVLMKPQTHGHSHEIEVFLLGQNINTVVLEIGILVHSLIIGVNLGITDDEGFVSLLIAIAFHQFFEAMALGALISSTRLEWKTKVMLGLAYPLTTPLGVAVGVIVRESFNSNSSSLILSQGILSSLSLGILMYNTYVELIAGEVNRNPIFKAYSPGFKFFCYLVMLVGASAMALIGIWA